jgi:glutamate N-acetyltransferase/amino-acid N-acetyltransferase
MLVYLFTDAKVEQGALQKVLSAHTDTTFNCITVDSDTSTSDSLILAATGASGVDATGNAAFEKALHDVMLDLAHQVVRDGEGATKFVEITVTGAVNAAEAKIHGMAIANSPLIKTAIAGEDPNWGRVVMAIGKSGAEADRDRISIQFGDVQVAKDGWRSPDYSEADAAAHMKGEHIRIAVDLGIGAGSATVWTCDLTHGYIEINADYRS